MVISMKIAYAKHYAIPTSSDIALYLYARYFELSISAGGWRVVPLVYCGWYLDMSVLGRACFPAPGNKGYLVKWLDM